MKEKRIHYNKGHHDLAVCGQIIGTIRATRNPDKVTCKICRARMKKWLRSEARNGHH